MDEKKLMSSIKCIEKSKIFEVSDRRASDQHMVAHGRGDAYVDLMWWLIR
jgi:hypothetical protein